MVMSESSMIGHLRHHGFFGDACVTMARNIHDLLRMADIPVSRGNVLKVIGSLPREQSHLKDDFWRDQLCSRAMEAAHQRDLGRPESIRRQELTAYFLGFATRDPRDQDLVIAAFNGVLSQEWEGFS
jgi:hypothetical protein